MPKIDLKLDAVLDIIPTGVYWKDRDGRYLGCNQYMLDLTGMKKHEEIVGKTDYDLWEKVIADTMRKNDVYAMEHGKYEVKERITCGKKTYTFSVTRTPLYKGKKVGGVMGVLVENADEKPMMDDYLYRILDVIPASIYWKDAEGHYLGCNKYMLDICNIGSRKMVLGKTDYDLPWSRQATEFKKNDQDAMRKGYAEVEESTVFKQKKRTFITTKTPLYNEAEEIQGIVGVSMDITDKKRVEALEVEKHLLEKSNEFIKILSGSIAHEIRTPLAAIGINIDILKNNIFCQEQEEIKNEDEVRHNIASIKQAVKEASNMVDMILVKLRNIIHGPIGKERFDRHSMKETLLKALAIYPFRDKEKLLIHLSLEEDFFYFGEVVLMQHVLFNLIKNALYAIKKAGKGEITIAMRTQEKGLNRLIFTDTGLGIPPDLAKHIFDKFETNDDTHSGAGIGLAFCKLTIESFGGSIKVRSREGEFAEFQMSFPKLKMK